MYWFAQQLQKLLFFFKKIPFLTIVFVSKDFFFKKLMFYIIVASLQ